MLTLDWLAQSLYNAHFWLVGFNAHNFAFAQTNQSCFSVEVLHQYFEATAQIPIYLSNSSFSCHSNLDDSHVRDLRETETKETCVNVAMETDSDWDGLYTTTTSRDSTVAGLFYAWITLIDNVIRLRGCVIHPKCDLLAVHLIVRMTTEWVSECAVGRPREYSSGKTYNWRGRTS